MEIANQTKKQGGWGLENVYLFVQVLIAKSLWRLLFIEGLWGKIIRCKYLCHLSVEQWIRVDPKSHHGASNVWKMLVSVFPLLRQWVAWKTGHGNQVRLGEDPWVGARENYYLSLNLRNHLRERSFVCLKEVGVLNPMGDGGSIG